MNISKTGFFLFLFLLFGALCFGQTTYNYVGFSEEFTVPSSSAWEYSFELIGGDGGTAEVDGCFSNAGSGARTTFNMFVGPGPGQIPYGTKIRLIVGNKGVGQSTDEQTAGRRGAGGGGTAVLAEIDNEWVILGVAGGGGGAYQGNFAGSCVDNEPGQGGQTGRNGGDGGGTFSGDGGTNGEGGDIGGGAGNACGGGGAFSDGEDYNGFAGKKGYPNGGFGGANGPLQGGWGFGGGGSAADGGGGGGGYSGGGGGSCLDNGGGGGSYINSEYIYNGETSSRSSTNNSLAGKIIVSSTEVCAAVASGFEYINPLCTEADQGRVQIIHSFNLGGSCNTQFEWRLEPLNGWNYLGDGVFRSMRAGDYTLNITNTEYGEVVDIFNFTIAPTTEAPLAACKDVTVTLQNGEYINPSLHNLINNGSTSICDEPLTLSASQTSFDCNNLGVNLVTLTVLGNNGVAATCESTVTVVLNNNDTPIANCQPDFSVDLAGNSSISLPVSAINNNSYATACEESISISHPELTCLNVETSVQVELTVVDQGGRTNQCTTTVTVLDSGTPNAVCKNVFMQILDVSGNFTLNPADLNLGSVSNNCTDLTYSADILDFDCNNIGDNDVTLTVTDGYGRSSSCQTVVEITEITSPIAICQDITVSIDENGSYTLDPSELDNGSSAGCTTCDAGCTPLLSSSVTSFDCDDLGEHIVTLTVTSAPNVMTTCQATVTVVDTVPPIAGCINSTVTLFNGNNNTFISLFGAFAQQSTDNCGGLSSYRFLVETTVYCEDLGEYEAQFEVVDLSGNRDTCTSIITVQDYALDPVVNCVENYTVELDDTGNYSFSEEDLGIILDNSVLRPGCAGPTILDTIISISSFDCEDLGIPTPVVFTIAQQGNIPGNCISTITVLDDISPVCQTAVAQLEVKAMLNGPYDPVSGLMNDELREQGLIPLISPYPGTGATTMANVLLTTGSNAIVDWILIELRDDQDSGTVLHTRAALLQRDGDIVDVDGVSPVRFPEAENGDYFVSIRHRNHLGIMMDIPVEIVKSIPQD